MESVIGIVVVLVVLYFVLMGNRKTERRGEDGEAVLSEDGASVAAIDEHKAWLSSRWSEAKRQLEAGDLKSFPSWYFDEVTERQARLLASKGINLPDGPVSKGQASDLIGLFFPVEEEDKAVLKFFKVSTKGLNQTTARAEVATLQADPENAAAWNQRPADPVQKEFYRFFGVKVPGGLTYSAADEYIAKYQETLDTHQLDDWDSYESILDELMDKDTRDSYDIKKPSVAAIRAAIEALRQSGMSLSDLEDDLEIVTQKLIELQPELEKKL